MPRNALRAAANWLNGSTPAGLLLARLGGATPQRGPDGVWEANGYRGPGRSRPFTVGSVVLVAGPPGTLDRRPRLRRHEVAHCGQWALLGPLFVPAYLLEALRSRVLCGDAVRCNWFEKWAGLADGGYLPGPVSSRGGRPGR